MFNQNDTEKDTPDIDTIEETNWENANALVDKLMGETEVVKIRFHTTGLYDQPSYERWQEYTEQVRYSNSKVCWNCREVII
jgi:hypothetical protein